MIDASASNWRVPRLSKNGSASPSKPNRSIIAIHLRLGLGVGAPLRAETEQQLLAHSGAADLAIGVLEQEAHLRGKLAGAQLRGGHAIDEDLARRRLQQTVYQAHRG